MQQEGQSEIGLDLGVHLTCSQKHTGTCQKPQWAALEQERSAERSLVQVQLENLRSKFTTIDFVTQQVRGAVAPYIDGPMLRDLMQQG